MKRFKTCLLAAAAALTLGSTAVCAAVTTAPLSEAVSGANGRLIFRQDFDNTDSYGSYVYDATYQSSYASSGAALGNTSYVYASDGDGSNPTFAVVDNPVENGSGKVLSMTGTSAYPMYKLNFKGSVLSKPGKYTLTVKAYKGQESISSAQCWFNVNNKNDNMKMGTLSLGGSAFSKNTYSTVIGTAEEYAAGEASGSLLSDIKLFAANAKERTVYFDDVELWYEEYADITFVLDCDSTAVSSLMATLLPITHKSYAPGAELPAPEIEQTGYKFLGWSKTAGDTENLVTKAEAGKYTLYAVYEQYTDAKATPFATETLGDYGRLIFKQDFESSDDMSAYSYSTVYQSPYANAGAMLGNSSYVYSTDGDATNPTFAVIDNPVGSGKVLSMTGTTAYPIYNLVFDGNVISKPGRYTVVIHTLGGTVTSAMFRPRFNNCLGNAQDFCSIGLGKDSFATTTASFVIETKEQFDATGTPATAYTKEHIYTLRSMYLFWKGGNGKTGYFDDIELWYEEYADVTFHLDGPESYVADAAAVAFPVTHQSFEPGDELPHFALSGVGYKFVGWSEKADDPTALVTTAKAGTYDLYAVYAEGEDEPIVEKDPVIAFTEVTTGEYGRLIYKQDFDDTTNISAYSYDPTYVSPYAKNGTTLADSTSVYTSDGDGSNPTFRLLRNPVTGQGQALRMTGTSAYPIYKLTFDNDVLSKPGKYTVIVRGYKGSGEAGEGVMRFYTNRATGTVSERGSISFGTTSFTKTAYDFTIVTKEEFDAKGLKETDYTYNNAFTLRSIYLFMRGGLNKSCYFDDIEIWYKEYADVTFHIDAPSDEIAALVEKNFPATHKSFEPGKLLTKLNIKGSGYKFVGWTTEKDDPEKILTHAVSGTYDLYAIFEVSDGADAEGYEDGLTVKDAVRLVAGLHARLSDKSVELSDGADYATCYAYAKRYGFLPKIEFDSEDRAILRSEMAEMLYKALPKSYQTAINEVTGVPDVTDTAHEKAVLTLYRAGIFAGVDTNGSFDSYDSLLRADFQTLVSRILYPEQRVRFTLTPEEVKETLILAKNTSKTFDAQYISLPLDYVKTLETFPTSTLTLGQWIWPQMYTRPHMRKDFEVTKTLAKAEMEFQCDNALDIYINGHEYTADTDENGWHVTGVVDITEHVKSGWNKIALRSYGTDKPMTFTAGIRGCIKLTYADGSTENVDTTTGFKSYMVCGFWEGTEPDGWETSDAPGSLSTTIVLSEHSRLLRKSGYFRKAFTLDKDVESATLYATANGLYVPYINGKRATEARFIPGSMQKISEYQVFDVTEFVASGDNVLAAVTGNGWYNCESWGVLYSKTPQLMMQLEIKYTDGSTEKVVTDASWLATASPLVENDIQYGERYDARMEIDGWNDVGTPSGTWVNATATSGSSKTFSQQTYPAVMVQEEIRAESMGLMPDGETYYYDFGWNTTGRAKIVLKNTTPGEQIIIRYCETFSKDMEPNLPLYSDCYFPDDSKDTGKAPYFARNIDVYICKGAAEEVYVPEFAYTGFRYVYISGYSGEYQLGTVRKIEMNTDLEEVGDIETSHEGIAMAWDAVKRSWRTNVFTGPMDCPTREKNFWNGDIQCFANTACWYTDNNAFLERWTESGRKMQNDVYGWEDEEYILPLILYKYYGNTDVIKSKYPVVQALIAKRKGQLPSGQLLPTDHAPYSDHSGIAKVPQDFFAAAYYTYMYKCAAEMADILGKTADKQAYLEEFETLRAAFNEKYYLADENDYSPHMQGGIIFPIAFGIADEENLAALAANYNSYVVENNYHLTCGFMSAEFALRILCEYGYADTAWKTASSKDYPSLIYMVNTGSGGTTTESWAGAGTGAGSNNHYAIGSVARYYFECLGGITITKPGMDAIKLTPYFEAELGDICMTYNSRHGLIASEWSYDAESDTFAWSVTAPNGVVAEIKLPEGFTMVSGSEGEVTGGSFNYTVKKN